jgi:hypothetical protein
MSESQNTVFAEKKGLSSSSALADTAPAAPIVHGVVQPRLFVCRSSFFPSAALGRRSFFERNSLMTRKSLFIRSLGVAATLAAVTFCSLNARAEVVFGNLGASGTNQYFGSSTNLKATSWLAQGFNTGTTSTNLTVSSITLGLFGVSEGTVPLTVSIYSNDSFNGNVPGTLLHTSSITNVGGDGNYPFAFTGADLAANTSYWIVPNGGGSVAWYLRGGATKVPTAQNSSGYSYVGTAGSLASTSSPSGPWSQGADNIISEGYTVSITAVPEPSTIVMAGLGGLGLLAIERNRRRRKAAVAAEADDYLG